MYPAQFRVQLDLKFMIDFESVDFQHFKTFFGNQ